MRCESFKKVKAGWNENIEVFFGGSNGIINFPMRFGKCRCPVASGSYLSVVEILDECGWS